MLQIYICKVVAAKTIYSTYDEQLKLAYCLRDNYMRIIVNRTRKAAQALTYDEMQHVSVFEFFRNLITIDFELLNL